MDIEGCEGVVLPRLLARRDNIDVIGEVGSSRNRALIWAAVEKFNFAVFSQQTGWQRCTAESELPSNYREGSIFISRSGLAPFARS
jgi:hypothetical protein